MFKKEALARIEASIAKAEKRTSGEIVPLIVDASHGYPFIYFVWALIGLGTAWIYFWLREIHWPQPYSWQQSMLIQTISMVAFSSLCFIPSLKRLLIPRSVMQKASYRALLSNFLASGLTETRERTGILIFVSRFERIVEILADKGIHEHTGEDYWKEQVKHITWGFKKKQPTEALIQSITAIGDKLAEHFPPRKDDVDELKNKVLFGHQDYLGFNSKAKEIKPEVKKIKPEVKKINPKVKKIKPKVKKIKQVKKVTKKKKGRSKK